MIKIRPLIILSVFYTLFASYLFIITEFYEGGFMNSGLFGVMIISFFILGLIIGLLDLIINAFIKSIKFKKFISNTILIIFSILLYILFNDFILS